jgi:hypothetical protein
MFNRHRRVVDKIGLWCNFRPSDREHFHQLTHFMYQCVYLMPLQAIAEYQILILWQLILNLMVERHEHYFLGYRNSFNIHCDCFKAVLKELGCWWTFMFLVCNFRGWECVFGAYRNQYQHLIVITCTNSIWTSFYMLNVEKKKSQIVKSQCISAVQFAHINGF